MLSLLQVWQQRLQLFWWILWNEKRVEKLTFLIIGASGFIGSALSSHLSSRYRIISLARDYDIVPKVDGIINLAGAPINRIWSSKVRKEIIDSRVGTTRKIVEQILKQKTFPRFFLSASAIGYYGDRGEETLTETSPRGDGFLSSVCQDWENASIPLEKKGVQRILTRFGIVLDRAGGMLKKLLPLARLHLAGRLGTGDQWISWISLHDLVSAIDFLIQRSDLQGPINCTSPHPIRQKEFANALAASIDARFQLPQPAALLRFLFGDMGKELLLSSTKALPRKLLDLGFQFDQPDISQAILVPPEWNEGIYPT